MFSALLNMFVTPSRSLESQKLKIMTFSFNNLTTQQRKAARKAALQSKMTYFAMVTIDYTRQDTNQYAKLVAALLQTGWRKIETTAFIFQGDLPTVLYSFELIAKQVQDAGVLSALNITVQGTIDFNGIKFVAAKNHPYAVKEIRRKPFPQPPAPAPKVDDVPPAG